MNTRADAPDDARFNIDVEEGNNSRRIDSSLWIPSQVTVVAYHGTPGEALADREGSQRVGKMILHQLMYHVSTVVVDGREDEHSAKVKRVPR